MGKRVVVSKAPLDGERELFAAWESLEKKESSRYFIIDIMCYKAL